MYNWHAEYTAKHERKQILNDMQKIRLEEQAFSLSLNRPGWFGRVMFWFGNWMVSTGKNIRHRYEAPSIKCQNSANGSFAR
jgi:hypothetical protein